MNDKKQTEERILECGKKEFLKKGFLGASLRQIVKEAGVTTGAFYGYYPNKEALFRALVEDHVDAMVNRTYESRHQFFDNGAMHQVETMGEISDSEVEWMTEYVYEHFDVFKLVVCHAHGTEFEDFIHRLSQPEVTATEQFVQTLKGLGYQIEPLDDQLVHILVSSFFSGFFEIVRHDMEVSKAKIFTKELKVFYTAGWRRILGLN